MEYKAYHLVAVLGSLGFCQIPDQLPVYPVLPGIVIVQDSEDIQKGGLPGSRGSHDGHELSALDPEVDTFQNMQRLRSEICLVDILKLNQHTLFLIYICVLVC